MGNGWRDAVGKPASDHVALTDVNFSDFIVKSHTWEGGV